MDPWDRRAGAAVIRPGFLRLSEGGQMVRTFCAALTVTFFLATCSLVWAQAGASATPEDDATVQVDAVESTASATDPDAGVTADEPTDADAGATDAAHVVEGAVEDAKESIEEMSDAVDRNEQAQRISAGILDPIYMLAEKLSFPYFHWLAFAAMVTGAVSFALQLVLGKLIVLSRMSLSPSEILADSLGLVISLVGLVLTTQAAAENSTFTTSSFAVISSAAVGVIAGFIFYVWGQRQELLAVEGRRTVAAAEKIAAAHEKKK